MQRRVFNNPVTSETTSTVCIPKRRTLGKTIPTPDIVPMSWEDKILKCLTHDDRWDYGNLSKNGELFTIKSLSVVHVPKNVISKMVLNKQITLGDDDYYSLVV